MPLPLSVTTRLESQHASLPDLLEGLTDRQIRRQVVTGKWSIFENIVHLQTYQHTFVKRIRRILEEDNPVFPPYTAEADPLFHDNCTRSGDEIMQDLQRVREEINRSILSLRDADLRRVTTHPAYGKMDLLLWLNFFLLHEAHHLFTILKLAGGLKKQQGQ